MSNSDWASNRLACGFLPGGRREFGDAEAGGGGQAMKHVGHPIPGIDSAAGESIDLEGLQTDGYRR